MKINKYYTKEDLIEALRDQGIPASYQNFIRKYEKTGQLKIRRSPLNDYRVLTKKEIDEIVKEVQENGKEFKWHYDKGGDNDE